MMHYILKSIFILLLFAFIDLSFIVSAVDVITISYTGDVQFRVIEGGGAHTCGITDNNKAYCRGANWDGQLGVGDTSMSYGEIPVSVTGDLSFIDISAGWYHTCGITDDNKAYCWGKNNEMDWWTFDTIGGMLGDGTLNNSLVPVPVTGGLSFVDISLRENHTCGITDNNKAYCRGINGNGQLGDGTLNDSLVPVLVTGDLSFIHISAGAHFSCGITDDNKAYCRGDNGNGQLGDGTLNDSLVPVPVTGGLSFNKISIASSNVCGMTVDNKIYCWSNGNNTPLQVGSSFSFIDIKAGQSHICGITDDNKAYCRGANGNGQLGDGTLNDSLVPVPVTGGLSFIKLGLGYIHTCGIDVNHDIYCWGANSRYQIGDGTTQQKNIPSNIESNHISSLYNHRYESGLSGSLVQSGTFITAIPYTGYTFSGWSDGVIYNPRSDILQSGLNINVNALYAQWIDSTPPMITLSGDATINLSAGATFSDPGATCIDNIDATCTVIASGTVNTAIPGSYTITYNATDVAGNTSNILIRIITVTSAPITPTPGYAGGGGGNSITKDNCPNGDYTSSYYDNACGTKPVVGINTGKVDQNIFNPTISNTCFTPMDKRTIYQGNDVTQGFRTAHQMLYSYGLTVWRGTVDYRPYDGLTREEAAKFMVEFARNVLCREKTRTYSDRFSDIAGTDKTLLGFIKESYEYEIFDGDKDNDGDGVTTFRPFDRISDDELATIMIRLITHNKYKNEATGDDRAAFYKEKLINYSTDARLTSNGRSIVAEVIYDLYRNNTYKLENVGYIVQ